MGDAPTEGTVRSADGTTIAYERSGDGPAVILVDAAGGFRDFGPMRSLAALLAPTCTVICFDRRGRGASTDTAPYTVDREVDDLRALVAVAGGAAGLYGFSSGAVLALLAAARGVPVTRLAPLDLTGEPDPDPGLAAEVAALVAAGRRGDAVALFQSRIGVPEELTAGLRHSPFWPALESSAHTLVHDLALTRALSPAELATVTVPTLVAQSANSDARLRGWARGVAGALPDGRHLSLAGDWHQVTVEELAPVLAGFLTDRRDG
ncbi:alpha/beta fold hydrolase [Micromonospora sp. NPDC092111]|uniref:alpha/beta fold hydrolase n=1 Tax=Micromonospora sp. NPDC092111 TaxID=3364289 RepID=UPI00381AA168